MPPLERRIAIFKALVGRLGKGAVVWRFDPLILTDKIGIGTLLKRIRNIGDQLHQFTEKLVFSFADILSYARVKANLDRNGIAYRDWTLRQMREFSERLVDLNKSEGWNLRLATCGETSDLDGIEHNSCVDEHLILRLSKSPEVWRFLGAEPCSGYDLSGRPAGAGDLGGGRFALVTRDNRDKGQRGACGCVKSKDIGQYNTCPHLCAYCYANYSKQGALRNHACHRANPCGEIIAG